MTPPETNPSGDRLVAGKASSQSASGIDAPAVVQALQEYRVESVRSVERLCAVDAMQRLGSTVAGSVILVTTGVARLPGID